MVLHGKPQEIVDDVCEVGKLFWLKIRGDCSNMLSVLSRGGGDGINFILISSLKLIFWLIYCCVGEDSRGIGRMVFL